MTNHRTSMRVQSALLDAYRGDSWRLLASPVGARHLPASPVPATQRKVLMWSFITFFSACLVRARQVCARHCSSARHVAYQLRSKRGIARFFISPKLQ